MSRRCLYLDMDGVVCDFETPISNIVGKVPVGRDPHDWIGPVEWKILADHPRLYRQLPKTTEADALVTRCKKFCEENDYELLFLTAVPHVGTMHWSYHDKTEWCREHYPEIPVHFGPYSRDKHLHCKSGDILIDDRPSNIRDWNAAGGHGILHQGDLQRTIARLESVVND